MLNWLQIPLPELFALLAAIAFAAGLNVYATVAALGLLARFGHVPLPPALQILETWPVIVASATLFTIEFFADKIPVFDLIWSALHTFVRVPAAALLAYGATRQLTPAQQLLAAALGAAIAFAAHGGKTALRAAITPSPEPVSNIALSLAEDALALGLTWLATRHPYTAAVIVLILVIIIVMMTRLVIKSLRALFRGAEKELVRPLI
jgi:lysylphosphatidylglycerol synthetase-like protein (DUF2156 family)